MNRKHRRFLAYEVVMTRIQITTFSSDDEPETRRSSDPREEPLSSTLDHSESEQPSMPKRGYAVGYGKPPKENQFQKGRSGNPRGRPRRSKSFDSAFLEQASALIAYTDAEGRKRKITKLEAFNLRLWASALKGDRHSMRLVVQLITRIAATQQQSPEEFALELHQTLRAMEASVCGGPPIKIAADNDNDPESALRRQQRS